MFCSILPFVFVLGKILLTFRFGGWERGEEGHYLLETTQTSSGFVGGVGGQASNRKLVWSFWVDGGDGGGLLPPIGTSRRPSTSPSPIPGDENRGAA